MTPFHCIILGDRKNPSLHVYTLCIGTFAFKMTTEIICLQDELPIVLITTCDLETFIKGHHMYKDIWTPKQDEQIDVLMEPDNRMDKFPVCGKLMTKLQGNVHPEGLQRQSFTSCAIMHTQALGQKLLVTSVILAVKREYKSLANWLYLDNQNLYLSYAKN